MRLRLPNGLVVLILAVLAWLAVVGVIEAIVWLGARW
jgi:hypothetical protein